jgi:D,D-heptose 1,7-bisphosphate phosphatase
MSFQADVLILAGGFGTRMSKYFPGIPKPMIPVAGVPILEHQINECKRYGFTKICLSLHFEAEKIQNYFGDGETFGVKIKYLIENIPLGTGGALLQAIELLSSNFLVLYADVYSDIDLKKLFNFHIDNAPAATIVAHPNNHPHDSDLLVLDNNNKVLEVCPHPHNLNTFFGNMVNAALYVFNRTLIKKNKLKVEKFDIAQELIPNIISLGMNVKAYVTIEYIKDMGSPERLKKVEEDIKSNVPISRSLRQQRNCIFFDRDGTLNKEVGHLNNIDDLELLPGASKAIAKVNSSQYIAICVTNQPVIARGDLTDDGFKKIMSKLDFELGIDGAYLDKFYYCPHHPDSGFEGEIVDLKINCKCRKPKSGMFIDAANNHNINLSKSWVIGDRTADILSAKKIGARSILVSTGAAGEDGKYMVRPHVHVDSISEAVDFILNEEKKLINFYNKILPALKSKSIICINGLSRAGKTTFANNLKWYLEQYKIFAHVLELDIFLKKDRLESQFFLERYDFKKAEEIVALFLSNNLKDFYDKGFDHNKNQVKHFGKEMIQEKSILIIEGIFTDFFKSNLDFNALKIFIQCNDKTRKQRFIKKYTQKGKTDDEISILWNKRMKNEDKKINEKINNADFIYNFTSDHGNK